VDEVFKAYLAALIDGEGCIGIAKQSRGESLPTFKPIIMVTNSHAGLIHLVHRITERGNVYISEPGPKHPANWSPMHRWTAVSQDAKDIVHFVLPFLLVKKHQAEVVLRFPQRAGRRKKGESDSTFKVQERLYLQAKELNRRGRKAAKVGEVPTDHPLLNRLRRRGL